MFPLWGFGPHPGLGFSSGGVRRALVYGILPMGNRVARIPRILPAGFPKVLVVVGSLMVTVGRSLGRPEARTFTGVVGRRQPRYAGTTSVVV